VVNLVNLAHLVHTLLTLVLVNVLAVLVVANTIQSLVDVTLADMVNFQLVEHNLVLLVLII